MTATLLAVAMALDAALGEPKCLWSRVAHPAVLMGRLIGWCDTRFNRSQVDRVTSYVALGVALLLLLILSMVINELPIAWIWRMLLLALILAQLMAFARSVLTDGSARKATGIAVTATLSALAVALGLVIQSLPLGWLWSLILTAILLAQRSLVDHVAAVATALRASLVQGRRSVSMIVGRDPDALDEPAVARAAIESAAENLSDGVIAPAFWFLVAGLPGILAYKIINTADSMIGHRTPRHEDFGWAAARLDDALNYIPARLTALLIALTTKPGALKIAAQDGPKHRSVNAGWPEAAMAAALGLSLSGPRAYGGELINDPEMNPSGTRNATPGDITAAVAVLWRVWAMTLALVVGIAVLGT